MANRSGLGIIDLVIFCLSVWRLSRMTTEEDGPLDMFKSIRELAGAEDNGVPMPWDELSSWGKLVQCPHCISVWLAAFLLVLKWVDKRTYSFVTLSLLGSSATVLIEESKQQ